MRQKVKERVEEAQKKQMYRPYLHRVCFYFTYGYCEDTEFSPPLLGDFKEEDAWLKRWNNYLTLTCLQALPKDITILGIEDNLELGVIKVYMTSRVFPVLIEGSPTAIYDGTSVEIMKNFLTSSIGTYE